jgi:hypothetical protein
MIKKISLSLFVVIFCLHIASSLFAQDATGTTTQPVDEKKVQEEMATAAKVEEKVAVAPEKGKWSHESELGAAIAGGNTNSKTITFKQTTSYAWSKNLLRLDGMFLYAFSNGTKTGQQWMAGLRYERIMTNWLSLFLGHNWQGDIFAGYDYRVNNDIGAKMWIVEGDKKNNYLFNETGYRFTYENRIAGVVPASLKLHYVRIYFEGAKSLTDILFAKVWTEFLPDLEHKSNFQFNFEPSLGVVLTKYLSLKLGFLGRYDNQPTIQTPVLKKFDYLYTTSLVAKF